MDLKKVCTVVAAITGIIAGLAEVTLKATDLKGVLKDLKEQGSEN